MAADLGTMCPRIPGRLTAELLHSRPQYMDCIGLYHLDLRGAIAKSETSLHRCLYEVATSVTGAVSEDCTFAGIRLSTIENLGATRVGTAYTFPTDICRFRSDTQFYAGPVQHN